MELFSDDFNNSCNFKQFSSKVKRDSVFKELDFNSIHSSLSGPEGAQ